jgi:succinyl-diaminopimelate desuccinylase
VAREPEVATSFTVRHLELAREVASAVDAGEVVRLTRELVRIDSVYRPEAGGNEAACAGFLAGYLADRGFEVALEEAAPGRPNVIADLEGEGDGPTLILEGHTDVVTEGDPSAWTRDPFGAEVDAGRIYGRGACDMKGGLAAAICAAIAVGDAAPALPGRLRLAIVADEEGMMLGIKSFIANGWADGVAGAIICEPEDNEICLFQKGALRTQATLHGQMAHGAMPYAGASPIPAAARFILGCADLEAEYFERHGEHPFLGRAHVTPTIVRAPVAGEPQHNVMPDNVLVALDVRTVPGQDHGAIRGDLERLLDDATAAYPAVRARLEILEERPWTETPADSGLVRSVEAAHRLALGQEPRYGGVPGATDGTFLHALAGVPIVTIGPGARTVPHRADEWVDISQLVAASRLYAAAAVLFRASHPSAGRPRPIGAPREESR